MASNTTAGSEERLKLAIAMALLRSKILNKPDTPSATLNSDALKWKRKAKERKEEILRLKHDLDEVEDGLHHELFPGSTSCRCYFFENMGKLSPDKISGEGFDGRFNDVLRRRFLRQVRLKERRKRRSDGSKQRLFLPEYIAEETEQLRASVDFLVELCDTISSVRVCWPPNKLHSSDPSFYMLTFHVSQVLFSTFYSLLALFLQPDDANFANWSHQAVDFILDAIKNILSKGKNIDPVEGIVGSLSLRLVRKMCTTLRGSGHQVDNDAQFHVQHLLRKLGSESYIGQRVILAVSQRISLLAENLLFLDPFEPTFPETHSSLYVLIQLMEFLVSDHLISWSKTDGFATELFEEWATSILHARKGVEVLENRCGVYIIYMDRVIGLVGKVVSQVTSLQTTTSTQIFFNP
ncbi:protein MULTIPOLAR SPINDLE 1 isoform X1 [Cynara cardunculus var. scolymus]|uniref:protein MULTIPOLAR SPINDLE 1 isoform X1 n=1 Tax=Cynara cardunculus var. scolymus TaxID=59895 RepID=UPI000D62FF88|nr:protein MULTIPOLAR SPINDLE 1 isoform X1 [Cynara cardunculus var. scolymus]XP_024980679.1 protein MULTIPOLAR SPINDLE 1 isoform X1 [Cynara cardunculus var. scolymus]